MKNRSDQKETRSLALKVAQVEDNGVFEGYAAVFGNVDSYDDIIEKGAFQKTLGSFKKSGRRPKMLWQHDRNEIIGKWEHIEEDQTGLYVRGRLYKDSDDVPLAKRAHFLLKEGELDSMSIGYFARDFSFDEKTWIRTLKEIELLEASLVTFPANDAARVSRVKAAEQIKTIRQFEDFLRDAGGFSANVAKAIASSGFKARDVAEFNREAQNIIAELSARY